MQSALPETLASETRYKFVVSSADEAVKVLRQRLGENARVISVRQMEGTGLSRFLRAPKLEVIAELIPAVKPAAPVTEPAPEPEPAVVEEEEKGEPEEMLARVLRRVGIPESLLLKWKTAGEWEFTSGLLLGDALAKVKLLLRAEFREQPRVALGNRVAFIGTAGTGKTTALCKRLSMDIFFHYRSAAVWKIDTDKPNPADGLAVYCGALGVPLIRTAEELPPLDPDSTLYLDLPGFSPDNSYEIDSVRSLLDEHEVSTRVLVVNAAYDAALIKNAYHLAERFAGTHVVFTHLDELVHWGKLWEFLLAGLSSPFSSVMGRTSRATLPRISSMSCWDEPSRRLVGNLLLTGQPYEVLPFARRRPWIPACILRQS